jgi:hypothetical protein
MLLIMILHPRLIVENLYTGVDDVLHVCRGMGREKRESVTPESTTMIKSGVFSVVRLRMAYGSICTRDTCIDYVIAPFKWHKWVITNWRTIRVADKKIVLYCFPWKNSDPFSCHNRGIVY